MFLLYFILVYHYRKLKKAIHALKIFSKSVFRDAIPLNSTVQNSITRTNTRSDTTLPP